MDQTAPVNSGSMPSSAPTAAYEAPHGSGKRKPLMIILLIVLAAGLGIGGYFLRINLQSKKAPVATTAQQTAVIPAGFTKAQELIAAGGNFVGKTLFQISYSGVLTAQDPGRSWDLKKGVKTVTIRQEGSQEVKYFRVAAPNAPAQSIEASDLKTGDGITLLVLVDTKTGIVSVNAITIAPKPGTQATPSATPAAKKP